MTSLSQMKIVSIFILTILTLFIFTAPVFSQTTSPVDISRYGFSRVIESKNIPANYASWLEAGSLRVDIPAGTFSSPVTFEILQGGNDAFLDQDLGDKIILLNYVFRVRHQNTQQLITKFNKPIDVGISLPRNYSNVELRDVELTEPVNIIKDIDFKVEGGDLVHKVDNTAVGWVVVGLKTGPDEEPTTKVSTSVTSVSNNQSFTPTNNSIWPILGIAGIMGGVLFLINRDQT